MFQSLLLHRPALDRTAFTQIPDEQGPKRALTYLPDERVLNPKPKGFGVPVGAKG